MSVMYAAVARFDPSRGAGWRSFVDWSQLRQLKEVVSLDGMLCPNVVEELTDEDWKHNVHADERVCFFRDLDYLLEKVVENQSASILAIIPHPTPADITSFTDSRFVFRGFDLIECGVSALVNCGGFDKAFASHEVSDCGLLSDLPRALQVQKALKAEYPDDHHANCELWAICQMTTIPDR
jgi:hypothetical protein